MKKKIVYYSVILAMIMGAALSRGFVKALFKPIKVKPSPIHVVVSTQAKKERPVVENVKHKEQSPSQYSRSDAITHIEGKGYYLKEIAHCNRALKIDPNNPDIYIRRGNAYLKLTECREALHDIGIAIDIINDTNESEIENNIQRGNKRYFFSNMDTEIFNAARTARYDAFVDTNIFKGGLP